MAFEKVIHKYFDRVFTEVDFVKKTYNDLKKYGFNDENAIASVCICRDEISQSLRSIIKHVWGEAFNLSSLGGMFFAGKTALKSAMHHAPIVDGKERYVYFAFPHIAIGAKGQLGFCRRRGRAEESNACGALNAVLKELKGNLLSYSVIPPHPPLEKGGWGDLIDNGDIEFSLLKMRLSKELPPGKIPDLLKLTKMTLKAIQSDFRSALKKIVDPKKCDYAFLTGIQINAPDGNYIWPAECYAFVNGIKKDVTL
jgi:hypothetical protein